MQKYTWMEYVQEHRTARIVNKPNLVLKDKIGSLHFISKANQP